MAGRHPPADAVVRGLTVVATPRRGIASAEIPKKGQKMKIAILRERSGDESRVAATPETVGKLVSLGAEVTVEKQAGRASGLLDAAYEEAGAKIAASAATALKDADVVLTVRRPTASSLSGVAKGALVIGMLDPYGNEKDIAGLAAAGVAAFAMEFMPRITRAQVMDVLSSQANLAGYRAVIEAAELFGKALPMMMTAAGTVRPAKAFIMGAGVAGLQAIATARRLGAAVSATDVRAAAGEQVESLGAKFIMTEALKDASGEGGYARELTKDEQAAQAELVAGHIAKQDIVVTTALIPGRPAPKLVDKAMVESMGPGSVIVDLAAERGGNCELTKPDEVVETENGVKIVGYTNLAGRIAATASQLYAKNLYSFLETMVDKESKALKVDWEDELVKATLLTREGKIVHQNFADVEVPAAAGAAKTTARKGTSRKTASKSTAAKSTTAKSGTAKSGAAKSTSARSGSAKSSAAKKTTGAAKKPAASKSAGSRSTGSKAGESKTAESKTTASGDAEAGKTPSAGEGEN